MKNIAYLLTCLQLAGAAAALLYPCSATAVEIPMLEGREHSYGGDIGHVFTLSLVPQAGAKPVIVFMELQKLEEDEGCDSPEYTDHIYGSISASGKKHYAFTDGEPRRAISFCLAELNDFNLDGIIDFRIDSFSGSGGRNFHYMTWRKDRFVEWPEAYDLGLNGDLEGDQITSYHRAGGGAFHRATYRIKNGKFELTSKIVTLSESDFAPYERKLYPRFMSPQGLLHIESHYRNGKLVKRSLYKDWD